MRAALPISIVAKSPSHSATLALNECFGLLAAVEMYLSVARSRTSYFA
jgi:hypothetical protein